MRRFDINRSKKIITAAVLLVITATAVITFIMMKGRLFKPEYFEKTSLTENNINLISERYQIDCSGYKIVKFSFSHAKNSCFTLEIRNVSRSELEKDFILNEGNCFIGKKNPNLRCSYSENEKTALITLEKYYSDLYKMVKS